MKKRDGRNGKREMHREEILKFLEDLDLKKRSSLAEMLTSSDEKRFIFNKRFWDGWTFQKIGQEIGVTAVACGKTFSRLVAKIEKLRYLEAKKEEYQETGKRDEIEISLLPCSMKFLNGSQVKYLHELTELTGKEYSEKYSLGKKTYREAIDWLRLFGFEFKKPL